MIMQFRHPDLPLDRRQCAPVITDRVLLGGLAIAFALLLGASAVSARSNETTAVDLHEIAQKTEKSNVRHDAVPMGISVPLPPPS